MPHGKRRAAFESKVQSIFELHFPNQILPFDVEAAQAFARIAAARRPARESVEDPVSRFPAPLVMR
jgi:predicted nucleic acid-binding protein